MGSTRLTRPPTGASPAEAGALVVGKSAVAIGHRAVRAPRRNGRGRRPRRCSGGLLRRGLELGVQLVVLHFQPGDDVGVLGGTIVLFAGVGGEVEELEGLRLVAGEETGVAGRVAGYCEPLPRGTGTTLPCQHAVSLARQGSSRGGES